MSENAVDAEEVRHMADLARVALNDEETELFSDQFGNILEYFDSLDEVPEIEQEVDLVNVMRADEECARLDQDEALQNAPETDEEYFKGPPVS